LNVQEKTGETAEGAEISLRGVSQTLGNGTSSAGGSIGPCYAVSQDLSRVPSLSLI
jgi:hypothetical protein